MWYAKLDDLLKSHGFKNLDPDACLYLLMDDEEIITKGSADTVDSLQQFAENALELFIVDRRFRLLLS